jgi:hypothetical protein
MNRQRQIDAFLSAAHRLAMQRLRERPERAADVLALIARWRHQRGPGRGDRYLDEWERLLSLPLEELERAVCGDGDRAEALRNASPLAPLITAAERDALLKQAREA